MRITVVSRIYRPEPAAASYFLGSVTDALLSAGHRVEVITASMPKGMSPEPRGETVRTFPVLRDRRGYVRGYLQYMSFDIPLFFRLLFVRRPDVIFVEPPPTTGAVVRMVCALRRIPYVYDAADIWSDAAETATGSRLVLRVLRVVERFALQGAKHIVTVSQGVADRLRALGVERPVTVTGFGADTIAFHYSEATTEKVLLYAGNYTQLHGADILIDAFAEFSRTHPGYVLRFIGNSIERGTLIQRAAQLGMSANVEFLDYIPAAHLQPFLAQAAVSLATQRPGVGYEYGFATKIYSALAVGCPVIFAGYGPTAPFIEEANRHINAGIAVAYDTSAIADALRHIAEEPVPASTRQMLAQWTKDNHSMAAVAERVRSIIENSMR